MEKSVQEVSAESATKAAFEKLKAAFDEFTAAYTADENAEAKSPEEMSDEELDSSISKGGSMMPSGV